MPRTFLEPRRAARSPVWPREGVAARRRRVRSFPRRRARPHPNTRAASYSLGGGALCSFPPTHSPITPSDKMASMMQNLETKVLSQIPGVDPRPAQRAQVSPACLRAPEPLSLLTSSPSGAVADPFSPFRRSPG